MAQLRGILFDKDGTVVDFNATWVPVLKRMALDLAGRDEDLADRLLRNGGLDPYSGTVAAGSLFGAGNTLDIVRAWFPDARGADFDALCARIDAHFVAGGAECSVAIPGCESALLALRADGYRIGLATNDSTAAARAALARLGISEHFEKVIGYDAVARPKPEPEMVHLFCSTVGLEPAEVAMVGDNVHDLHMARAAGAVAVGVLSGNGGRHDLEPHADAVLESIADLPAWLADRQA